MKADRRKLVGNALSSSIQVIVSAAVLLELYRFLMRHLSVAQIGIWSLVMASTAIGRLSDFGLGAGVVRFVAADLGIGAADRAARTVSMAALAIAMLIGIACVVLYPALWYVLAHLISDGDALGSARTLLPYALVALWLSSLANVGLSALDGLQRIDLRAAITIVAAVVQLLCAYVVVPRHGVTGLAVAQLVQIAVLLVAGGIFVWAGLSQPPRSWLRWESARFRELIRYGGGLQVAAVGQLVFEPTAKALLTKFGGLAMTGYYDMANRMVSQLRSIIMAAFQALVPYVSGAAPNPEEIRRLYRGTYRILLFLAVPYYAVIAAGLPVLLTLWLGRIERDFVNITLFVLAGWACNTLVGPAYFLYVATGRLRWTILSHLAIGFGTLALGLAGGLVFGGFGALAGVSLALAAGSGVVTVAFHRDYGLNMRELLPQESLVLLLASFSSSVLLLLICNAAVGSDHWMAVLVSAPLVQLVLVMLLSWRNPNRQKLFAMLQRLVNRTGDASA